MNYEKQQREITNKIDEIKKQLANSKLKLYTFELELNNIELDISDLKNDITDFKAQKTQCMECIKTAPNVPTRKIYRSARDALTKQINDAEKHMQHLDLQNDIQQNHLHEEFLQEQYLNNQLSELENELKQIDDFRNLSTQKNNIELLEKELAEQTETEEIVSKLHNAINRKQNLTQLIIYKIELIKLFMQKRKIHEKLCEPLRDDIDDETDDYSYGEVQTHIAEIESLIHTIEKKINKYNERNIDNEIITESDNDGDIESD